MPRTLSVLVVLSALLTAGHALAEDATVALQAESPSNGAAALVGPSVGLNGPPTAFSFQVHYWHAFDAAWGFYSVAGMDVSGEATMESDDSRVADARYPSTLGGRLFAGVRYVFEALDLPVETYARGGALVTVTGGEEMIGYSVGAAGAAGLSYAVSPDLELVAETELDLGVGQYRAQGVVPAASWNLLVGAQFRF